MGPTVISMKKMNKIRPVSSSSPPPAPSIRQYDTARPPVAGGGAGSPTARHTRAVLHQFLPIFTGRTISQCGWVCGSSDCCEGGGEQLDNQCDVQQLQSVYSWTWSFNNLTSLIIYHQSETFFQLPTNKVRSLKIVCTMLKVNFSVY